MSTLAIQRGLRYYDSTIGRLLPRITDVLTPDSLRRIARRLGRYRDEI